MQELCYKYGSTIVYFEPYLKYTVNNINQSDMNRITKTNASKQVITQISKHRNDYFFVGRTEMHNARLFIASRELWDAQNYIVKKIYELCCPMNTPYYAEREMLLTYVKGKQPARKIGFDVIRSIMAKMLWFDPNVEKQVYNFMELFNIKSIDDFQRKAIHAVFNEKVSIVSGGPGRGKSSCVLKCILYAIDCIYSVPTYDPQFETYHLGETRIITKETSTDIIQEMLPYAGNETEQDIMFVHVVSFTGKAVSRIKEVLTPPDMYNSFEPMTIHRLIMKCKKFKWLRQMPTTIIVDEVSMVSDILFYKLIRTFSNIEKIVLLGDVDQLPPIQPGNLLKEFIQSRCLPVTRLVKNYRQGTGSGLPNIADKIIGRESRGAGKSRIFGGWDHALNIPTKKNHTHKSRSTN